MRRTSTKSKVSLALVLLIGFTIGILFETQMGFTSVVGNNEKSETIAESPDFSQDYHSLAQQLSQAFESAAEKVSSSVVPIFAEQVVEVTNPFGYSEDPFKDFFGDDFFKRFFGTPNMGKEKRTIHGLGSGVIVTEDGYILTNNHVVDNADKLTVVLKNEKKYKAKIVGTDPQSQGQKSLLP